MQYVISGGVCILYLQVWPRAPWEPPSTVRGSIRLIERAQSAIDPTWCTLDSSKVSAVCEDS